MSTLIAVSGAAVFAQDGNRFVFDTGKLIKTVALDESGRFYTEAVTAGPQTWLEPGPNARADEFFLTLNGKKISGRSGGWSLVGTSHSTRSQGELEAVVILRKEGLTVERHYVLYPGLPTLGEFTTFRNDTGADLTLDRPSIFTVRQPHRENVDFSYMTGGANFTGSLIYKTNALVDGYRKDFDSNGDPELAPVDGKIVDERHEVCDGTGIWCEFFTLGDKQNSGGWFVTFDYQGWWKAACSDLDDTQLLQGWCELIHYPFPAGASMTMPNTTMGLWQGDMDDLGNTIAEYIYTYKWDYTRPRYFLQGVTGIWREAPLTQRLFRMIEIARYTGMEKIHIDGFWSDARSNWNGIGGDDWVHNCAFIRRNGMDFKLWMPPWHADRLSKLWLEHPDWMCGWHGSWYNWTIDMSREEAYQWILDMITRKQQEFGDYMLRVDGNPTSIKGNDSYTYTGGGSYNDTFKQSENYYRLCKEFKDRNPNAGLEGCSSGGHTLTIEATRYVESQQLTDGWARHNGSYYASLFCPVDKITGFPGSGAGSQNPERPLPMEYLERQREDHLLFRWMRREGLRGRWIKVYRPELEHGDKTYLLQHMTWDCLRGYLMIYNSTGNPIQGKSARIYPKKLVPEEKYLIEALRGSMEPEEKTGAQWMAEGIWLPKVQPGEVLLFNCQGRPGTSGDTLPPTDPGKPAVERENWLGHTGAGISWTPSEDGCMMAYYEVEKNGEIITKVSVGTYYFDDGADGSDVYRVRAVDAEGNCSAWVG